MQTSRERGGGDGRGAYADYTVAAATVVVVLVVGFALAVEAVLV